MAQKKPAQFVHRWWRGVSHVTSQPALMLSVSVIGCLMLWLASKQVKTLVQVLTELQVFGPSHAKVLPERPRYCLFGLLTLTFVWVDLVLARKLLHAVCSVVAWSRNKLHGGQGQAETPDVSPQRTRPARPSRKNPIRSCRFAGRSYMLL